MSAVDPEVRRLARLDSHKRVAWLRAQIRGYTVDLAARKYFGLPTFCDGEKIHDPKSEAGGACIQIAIRCGLSEDETRAAFDAEWSAAMKIAEQAGEKLKIAALSSIKISGSSAGVEHALRNACRRFHDAWPFLTDADISAIAAGFQRLPRRRVSQ